MSTGSIYGKCSTMCSREEIAFRTKNHLIHPLESIDSTAAHKDLIADPSKMVKEYVRSAAGVATDTDANIRPPSVLLTTTNYLLQLFNEKRDSHLSIAYSFVSDRLRAIRQDLIIQNLWNQETIMILERMIPFYVETLFLGLTSSFPSFELVLHSTQLHECYSRWLDCSVTAERSSEIILCFLLFIYSQSSYDNAFFDYLNMLTDDLKKHVTDILYAFKSCNYIRFFRLLEKLPSKTTRRSAIYLIEKLRIRAVDVISIAYKSSTAKLPKSDIRFWLGYSESDHLGLSQFDDNFVSVLELKKSLSTCWPRSLYISHLLV